ncbi:hypothetical protein EA462_08275 [Natrarchaeobius halalkaliphilus]|uniref:Uncharacterized protein n=1 Tax=Natrarchaeobius halalkaliphilus TaxID=1679091 RepID=A0A3N6LLT2_9EURY|nr:hypothetical protein [Natrarchaeobius halalkaliphilus]RQG89993.1 hypothetical protein EA462_08275 [Natrarchaeobius halalkaliphilus]
MNRFTRRDVLLTTGSFGAITVSGCLNDPSTGDGNGGSGGNGDGNGSGNDNSVDNGDASFDTFQLGPSLSRPLWAERADDPPGFVTVIETERDEPWMVDDPDEIDGLEEWYGETDFDESVIVFVGTVGPNTCYSEVDVDDVTISTVTLEGEDSRPAITAAARPVDTSDEDEACGEAVTYPSAFVRVTGDDLPSEALFTVTNGWDETDDVDSAGGLIDPAELPGFVRPPHDPETVPEALSCDEDEFERHWSPDDEISWGETTDDDGSPKLSLRAENAEYSGDDAAEALEFGRGDEIRIRMRNVSDRPVMTGNRNKYNLEVSTEDGWADVRGTTDDDPIDYTDEGVVHSPGDGFEWTIELTEAGILSASAHEDRFEICPDLPDGRYRFVFRGTSGDATLAVAFDYGGA